MAHQAYIALGSNVGDRRANLALAAGRLRSHPAISDWVMSSIHETAPVGGPPDQGAYLNAAAGLATTLDAHDLLLVLHQTERDAGRVRRERWGPRTLDLDLLLFDQERVDSSELVVPHPRMHERPFVLRPLAEIAPAVVHPILRKTVAELLHDLEPSGGA